MKKMKMDYSAAEISVLFSCLEMNCNMSERKVTLFSYLISLKDPFLLLLTEIT